MMMSLLVCVGCSTNTGPGEKPERAESPDSITVACYYFPNYHPTDARMNKLKGKPWSEWELVKIARPRFEGHQQPKVPLWGYTDESDSKAMAQKIDAAADHGIDAFIFDWYWDNTGIYWERGLEEGFLKAPNNNRLKFGLMWAMWDFFDLFPYRRGTPRTVLYPGKVTDEVFREACDYCIEKYFKHPSYWKIDGKPYFSIYDLNMLAESFGTLESARAALDDFRARVKDAGFPGLHLNAVPWNAKDPGKTVKALGFDSVTSYVWIHHVRLPKMQTDYVYVRDEYFKYWDKAEKMFDAPYHPNVTMGWDSSPRARQEDKYEDSAGYPFMNTISGNTPERFRDALAATKQRLAKSPGPRIMTINCWNEWTEGSYLEPDTLNRMAYLEAVKGVFGKTQIPDKSTNPDKQ